MKGTFAMNALATRCLRSFTYSATTHRPTESSAVRQKLAVWVLLPILVALAIPALGQTPFQAEVVKHLTTSRDFTLKVADAMPAADYGFKLTPPQMSFAEQMTHLSQSLNYFLSTFSGQKPNPGKPKSESKEDVMAFIRQSFDDAIATVGKLTPEQLAKTYKSEEGTETGTGLLLGMLDHTTHHRASAEMYLRAKGITPPEYQF
jgi:uncharacterized damage-inducible protein DinB